MCKSLAVATRSAIASGSAWEAGVSESSIRAAVLVPLVPAGSDIEVILTLRTESLPTHKGQVAFPGGRFGPRYDESLVDTALREAEEEIGLRRGDVEIVGSLPDVQTMSSRFVITPLVGRIPADYPFVLDPGEVAEVFAMPLCGPTPTPPCAAAIRGR